MKSKINLFGFCILFILVGCSKYEECCIQGKCEIIVNGTQSYLLWEDEKEDTDGVCYYIPEVVQNGIDLNCTCDKWISVISQKRTLDCIKVGTHVGDGAEIIC